jgi:hypothetical protein
VWCDAADRSQPGEADGIRSGESTGKTRPELRATGSSGRVTGLRGLMCRSAAGDDVPAIFLILFPYILTKGTFMFHFPLFGTKWMMMMTLARDHPGIMAIKQLALIGPRLMDFFSCDRSVDRVAKHSFGPS